ncbi:hypothetical protein [Serratia marcescens]|uniref:hypothetical protein n=1 Tax=Serratia TaxID=613 RepID=UPI002012D00B|nr:hypothetical protein [Serratia marcescens]
MRAFFLLCVSRAGLCLGTMMFAGALPTIRSEWQLDAASAGTVQTVFSLTNALALLVASWWLPGGVIRWGRAGFTCCFPGWAPLR